ncbi:hypothetical protein SELMODRAFT_421922 [Selaginella moellendorffii]|uniref:Uncharacterized protein n=1 Tax=Selaginella moellendorffii TaxID=88036 RepID=D8SGS5_SELML|nr:hypothetical protein SELMODRAFT_421922 [Selaginella moellendorffii]
MPTNVAPSNGITTMISLATQPIQHGHSEAIRLCQRMEPDGVEPDEITYVTCDMQSLVEGRPVHDRIVRAGLENGALALQVAGYHLKGNFFGTFQDVRPFSPEYKKDCEVIKGLKAYIWRITRMERLPIRTRDLMDLMDVVSKLLYESLPGDSGKETRTTGEEIQGKSSFPLVEELPKKKREADVGDAKNLEEEDYKLLDGISKKPRLTKIVPKKYNLRAHEQHTATLCSMYQCH